MLTGLTPRDLDLWPTSDEDKARLMQVFHDLPSANLVATTEFNSLFEVNNSSVVYDVEIVTKVHPPSLVQKLQSFDIALSCIGVQLVGLRAVDVFVHPDVAHSLVAREPLLIIPMPNEPFLLATAERLLRYADELKFPNPALQLEFLLQKFRSKTDEEKATLVENYCKTSHSSFWRTQVCKYFALPSLQVKKCE